MVCFNHIVRARLHPTTNHAFVQNEQSSNFLPFVSGFAHALHIYNFILK